MLPAAWHPWFCIAITVTVFVLIQVRKRMPLDWLFLVALMAVTFAGVITPAEAFAGFSNTAVISIASLIALASGLRRCGVLDWLGQLLLGSARTSRSALLRLALALIPSSAFLLNTAVVAMMAPMLVDWCRRNRVSPSQVMMPLSYLTILGGVCTLVGTSTTLVVNARLQDMSSSPAATSDVVPMGMFEIGMVGLPCAIAGAVYLLVVGHRLLPKRTDVVEDFGGQTREYLVEMIVEGHCSFVGKTIEEAGLRNLPGLFLGEIDRGDEILSPVARHDRIFSGDRLVFSGVVATIIDLEKTPGLIPATDTEEHVSIRQQRARQLTEVVLSPACPLLGQPVREANFRSHYGAAILAVHRNGERLQCKVGEIELQAGDTLLLQSRGDFVERWGQSRDFYMVSSISGYHPIQTRHLPIALLIFVALLAWMVISSLLGFDGRSALANPASLAVLAVLLFTLTGCMSMSDARNSVDLRLLLAIAGALGLAVALDKSKAAEMVAQAVIQSVGTEPVILLATCWILTSLLTEMLTNNAVAALMLPIAINLAHLNDLNARPFIMAVAMAASLSFITPVGYQTNLMVMGPGGYRPSDFARVGLPMSLCVGVVGIALIPWIWPF